MAMHILRNTVRRLHHFYMNLSIRYKLMLLFSIIIIFLSSSLGAYSYIISARNIKNEVSLANLQVVEQISSNIDFLQKDIDDLSTFVLLNPDIQSLIQINKSSVSDISSEEYLVFNNASKYLSNLFASKDYISFIIVYGKNGLPYYLSGDGSTGISGYDSIKNTPLYEKAISLKGKPFWTVLDNDSQTYILDNKNPKIAICRALLSTDKLNISGLMIICINVATIDNIYSSNLNGKKGSILILDDNNNIITYKSNLSLEYTDIKDDLLPCITGSEGRKTVRLKGEEMIVTYRATGISKWKVIHTIPVAELNRQISSIFDITIFLIIGCLIVSFVLTAFVTSIFTKPINKLLISMKRFQEGNFNEKVNFSYKDEIGMLGAGYNTMVDNIQALVNSMYKLQLKGKEAELKALQAQINPHFLYNTLDTIFWKAQKLKDKDIGEMVYALSQLFRLTLNSGREFTTIAREKQLIECYLLLQKRRYRQKLDYNINIDDSILGYSIPKLIIQPFIENAIVHGIKAKNMEGVVTVSGFSRDGKITFVIEDTGEGMDEDTLRTVITALSVDEPESASRSGYAIRNVQDRLKIHYGDQFELNIESEYGKGTRVVVTIPAQQIEKEADATEGQGIV
jgi:two-component system sensor histidine kinase YesM